MENGLAVYGSFIKDIKDLIYRRQYEAMKKVNTELIQLYWEIGGEIEHQQREQGWGKAVVEALAKELQKEFPGVQGFSARNLWLMRSFYNEYSHNSILHPMGAELLDSNLHPMGAELQRIPLPRLLAEIGWKKNTIIMEKCKDSQQRLFYINLIIVIKGRKDNRLMQEQQNIEWKENWHDEYLEWICGYANAQGGVLIIGKDNKGVPVGVTNTKKLLEDIPNKIVSTMGIIADVNLVQEAGQNLIEIEVEKYPSLISYRGKHYYRSGSTMRTINGVELERRLSKSMGRTWDAMTVPKATVDDLRQDAIDFFKEKAVARERLTREDVDVSNQVLLENLNLFDDEDHLVRAAVMAFHKDPEKWVTGAHIKIGYFVTDSDIRYMDEVYGSLIEQVDKTMDLVYTKYMKALVDYEGIHRIEQFMFHPDAFKEILLNAIVHKDYRDCNPIQISVYEDKIYVYNDGTMPPNLNTTEKLFMKHSSKPFNPKLAQIFFKSGMIETWGRGFDKIREACAKYDAPLPEYDISDVGVMVLCKPCERYLRLLNNNSLINNDRIMSELLSEKEIEKMTAILVFLQDNSTITNKKGRDLTNKSAATVRRYLERLCEVGLLEASGGTKGALYTKTGENRFAHKA